MDGKNENVEIISMPTDKLGLRRELVGIKFIIRMIISIGKREREGGGEGACGSIINQ